MATVTVYGHSDDLIELEGDRREEWGAYKNPRYVHFSDGTVLKCEYGPSTTELAVWVVEVAKAGTAKVTIEKAQTDDDDSDRATVEGDFDPVTIGLWDSVEVGDREIAERIMEMIEDGSMDRRQIESLPPEKLRRLHSLLCEALQ